MRMREHVEARTYLICISAAVMTAGCPVCVSGGPDVAADSRPAGVQDAASPAVVQMAGGTANIDPAQLSRSVESDSELASINQDEE